MGFFTAISAACDASWLALLMADHTAYDHERGHRADYGTDAGNDGPVLRLLLYRWMRKQYAGSTQGRSSALARESISDAGHWLFYEEPGRFNSEIVAFAQECEQQLSAQR